MKKKYIAFVAGLLLIAIIVIFGNIFLIKNIDVVFVNKPQFANEDSIVSASKISMNTNIFNINDENIKQNIRSYYDNNSVAVLDVERVFPNKVIIHVKERKPILIAHYGDEGQCIPTDINFQMTQKKNFSEIDYDFIEINGAKVFSTFNTPSFVQIHHAIRAFTDMNFTENGLVTFIKEIEVSDENIKIVLRQGDCVFEISRDDPQQIYQKTKLAYSQFLDLDYASRNICHIQV